VGRRGLYTILAVFPACHTGDVHHRALPSSHRQISRHNLFFHWAPKALRAPNTIESRDYNQWATTTSEGVHPSTRSASRAERAGGQPRARHRLLTRGDRCTPSRSVNAAAPRCHGRSGCWSSQYMVDHLQVGLRRTCLSPYCSPCSVSAPVTSPPLDGAHQIPYIDFDSSTRDRVQYHHNMTSRWRHRVLHQQVPDGNIQKWRLK